MTAPQSLRRLSKAEMTEVSAAVARFAVLIGRAKSLHAEKQRGDKHRPPCGAR